MDTEIGNLMVSAGLARRMGNGTSRLSSGRDEHDG